MSEEYIWKTAYTFDSYAHAKLAFAQLKDSLSYVLGSRFIAYALNRNIQIRHSESNNQRIEIGFDKSVPSELHETIRVYCNRFCGGYVRGLMEGD